MVRHYSHQMLIAASFGITSGTITALGMIVGLYAATSSRLAVASGIVVMAIADGLADAMGMHTVEEAEFEHGNAKHDAKELRLTTIYTFLSVCGFILTFAIPVILFPLGIAVAIDIAWGLGLLVFLSYYIAKIRKDNPMTTVMEHVLSAIFVIIVSYLIGYLMGSMME
jgi:VIT1/CCC1 family predicted Fe2+/Mn2+ transporter